MKNRVTAVLLSYLLLVSGIQTLVRAQNDLPSVPETAVGAGEEVCTGDNLLANPSFEGEYPVYVMAPPGHPDCQTWSEEAPNQYCERVKMADDWHPWWRSVPRTEVWMNIQPEYVPSLPHEQPPRVRSGEKAQHYFSFWSTHEAGMYQQVTAVPGGEYCFSAWGHAWSSRTSLPDYTSDPNDHGELYQRVGIDPTGGTDWQSPNVIWGDMRMQYDEFGLFTVETIAQADTITVFTWSRPNIPVKHNDVYWDDGRLTLLEAASVTPGTITALADVDEATTSIHTVAIEVTAGLNWTASLDPAGTITPTLSANKGTETAVLQVGLDSSGLPVGTYETTLTLTFDPAVAGTPTEIPITLIVVEEISRAFLPVVIRP